MSVVIMTKNEQHHIEGCLAALRDFDEIFVVDSASTDRTLALAREAGVNVVAFEWDGRYPKKKQWCLSNLAFTYDWVLFVDADEIVTGAFVSELTALFRYSMPHSGYFISYDYAFLGSVLRHGWRARKLALLDRRVTRFVDMDDLGVSNFWEVEGHYQPEVTGSLGTLEARVLHADHDSLYQFFERHNRYSDWEAHVHVKGLATHPLEARLGMRSLLKRLFPRVPFRGAAFFLYSYVLCRGFLDGRAGRDYALSKAFYYWQIELKERELQHAANGDGSKSGP